MLKRPQKLRLHIIANAALGPGLSGGDRIFIELARRAARKGYAVNVFVWEEGLAMCKRNCLENVNYIVWPARSFAKFGLPLSYLLRTIKGCIRAFRHECDNDNCVIYSASDFWPDSLPGFLMSRKLRGSKWIGSLYSFAPNPLSKAGRRYVKGIGSLIKYLLYYLSQKPAYWLIKKYADMVFVTNEPDRSKFVTRNRSIDRIVAVKGGVDLELLVRIPAPKEKKHDAIFIGRIVPQKGVLELIEIWRLVCEKKRDARLALYGDGPLMEKVKERIKRYNLENNIDLFGFVDGISKVEGIKASKIVVHPSVYDSGGMAAAEAMACGLPGVSFDIEALRTYYPKGMLKAPIGNYERFANLVVKLLVDRRLYEKTKMDALELAHEWGWEIVIENILREITKLILESDISRNVAPLQDS